MMQFSFSVLVFSAVAFFLALIVIVFVHEYGHFQVGRWCGVKIETFSVGFGREIFGFNDSKGTRWKFCWIPLGGYVRFHGDANSASLPSSTQAPAEGSLQAADLWKRALIVAAGPFANFLMATLIFAAAYVFVGTPISEPRVDGLTDDGAAKMAGIQKGDFIRVIDGKPIHTFSDIVKSLILQGQTPIALEIERNGQTIKLNLVPSIVEETDATGHKITSSRIGITHDGTNDKKGFERLSPLPALVKGVEDTRFIAWTTLRYIGKVFLGTEKANQLHGPVGIAQLAGETASMGMWPFIYFIALISVSIGLVNLFPIPMLDGGHLVFYFIEALIGKPVGAVAQEWSFRIGLSAMLMLMIFATINDLSPYATKIFGP